jgi:hypothetical protein
MEVAALAEAYVQLAHFDWRSAYWPCYPGYLLAALCAGLLTKLLWARFHLKLSGVASTRISVALNVADMIADVPGLALVGLVWKIVVRSALPTLPWEAWLSIAGMFVISGLYGLLRTKLDLVIVRRMSNLRLPMRENGLLYGCNVGLVFLGLAGLYAWCSACVR